MITTARTRAMLLMLSVSTVAGIVFNNVRVAQISMAPLIWIGMEWIIFRIRIQLVAKSITVSRNLVGQQGAIQTMWLRRSYSMTVDIECPSRLGLSYVEVSDRKPYAVSTPEHSTRVVGRLSTKHPLQLTYSINAKSAGIVRFEGVRIRIADLQGLFSYELFLRQPQSYKVLPPLVDVGTRSTVWKRYNLLPPPGIHRHHFPGIGSELLELREYVPGDSPRAIAWKVSARRDVLMTKEFESEVPVKVTLFLDISNSVRIGYPGPTALSSFVNLTASIMEIAVSNRDPVGLAMFNAAGCKVIDPSANRRVVIKMLNQLVDAVAAPLDPIPCPPDELFNQCASMMQELYPQFFDEGVNRPPFRFFPIRPSRRRTHKLRFQIANFLATYYEMPISATATMVQDDLAFSTYLQRFISEHHGVYGGPLFDDQGNYHFADAEKVNVLSRSLSRSVSKQHDNELFVLMIDLTDVESKFDTLYTTVKVALARHHRVVVVLAWPPGEAAPDTAEAVVRNVGDLEGLLRRSDRIRLESGYRTLRTKLSRLRVPVVTAADSIAMRLILGQMELLRTGRVVS